MIPPLVENETGFSCSEICRVLNDCDDTNAIYRMSSGISKVLHINASRVRDELSYPEFWRGVR